MSNIREATDDNFQDLVINSEKPVIVDFWAAWCGPCRLVAPEIDKLAEKYAGSVEVVKLDVDANPHTAMHYGIMSIPTVALRAGPAAARRGGLPPGRAAGGRLQPGLLDGSCRRASRRRRRQRLTEPQSQRRPPAGVLLSGILRPCAPATLDGQPRRGRWRGRRGADLPRARSGRSPPVAAADGGLVVAQAQVQPADHRIHVTSTRWPPRWSRIPRRGRSITRVSRSPSRPVRRTSWPRPAVSPSAPASRRPTTTSPPSS